jgi:hypothetical protein|tara:strand:+ start:8288 stop:9679 length:1392 start_codon:yes stop_codon:yes gene_type:complete
MSIDKRTATQPKPNSGPFIGKIVNHLDPKFSGAVEVELLKITESGNLSETTGQIVECQYLSPFYGVTPFRGLTKNDGYDFTQKAYGMWAIPPDVGTKVLVIFVEGNAGKGFWIGCIQDEYMNFSVPGNASTTFNDKDSTKSLPVAEYNKKQETAKGRDPTKFIKPHNDLQYSILETQGLLEDQIRGSNTSSARREAPSMVFGWSTPGPADKRSGKPKVKYGTKGSQSDVPFSRLGGSSFVMDDGDASLLRKGTASTTGPTYANIEAGDTGGDPSIPANELIRLRTRTGHQILLHNSEDLIYISNAKGTSWLEMTSNGKIDIFAQDSVSIHTSNDFNLKADRDINIEAGNNINMISAQNIFQKTGANWEVKAGVDGKLTAANGTHINAKTHTETAPDNIHMNGPTAAIATDATSPNRVPQHEPWQGHENLNPAEFTPDKTVSSTGATEPTATSTTIFDTFKKQT